MAFWTAYEMLVRGAELTGRSTQSKAVVDEQTPGRPPTPRACTSDGKRGRGRFRVVSVENRSPTEQPQPGVAVPQGDDGDLTDMLGELRVLLPTAQLLSAFLTTVPFTTGFGKIVVVEKHIFLATFVLSIASLVLLSAPAVQHRIVRPLKDRAAYKRLATRQILVGASCLGVALVLVTQLVLSEVLGHVVGNVAAALCAALIALLWWVLPKIWQARGSV